MKSDSPNCKPNLALRVVPLPLGAIGRLIVALHRANEEPQLNFYWKGGCGVFVRECYIIVESDGEKVVHRFALGILILDRSSSIRRPRKWRAYAGMLYVTHSAL